MRNRFCTILFFAAGIAIAQREPGYDRSVVSQVRIDARDLGYAPDDLIPSGESAVTALAARPDNGIVYGATSGKRSHLFLLDPVHGYVQPLGYLKDVTTVRRSLAVMPNGDVYIGGSIAVDNNGAGYGSYPGGHLLRYRPPADLSRRPIRVDAPCDVADLGVAAEHEGIYALASDPSGYLYGLTYPSGNFFRYGVVDGKFSLLGKVAEHRIHGEKFEQDRLIGRAIAIARNGDVFTTGEDGAVFRFHPGDRAIERLAVTIPSEPGREGYNRIEVWCTDPSSKAESGAFYGGTSDGYLVRFQPDTLTFENLGKPLNQYRVNGLVAAKNGKLYGVGGDADDMARLFSYDPKSGYRILGFIDVNRRPYYAWQAYRIEAMCIGPDDTVYLGEGERRSRLYLFYPY